MDAAIFAKAKDLKDKILFTLFILLVYRLGCYIAVPGIDASAMAEFSSANSKGILSMFNALSGGALSRLSVFSLSIFPYITSSILMQLLVATYKPLEEMKKDSEDGMRKINQYTRYLTVALAMFQAYGVARGLEGSASKFAGIVHDPGMFFRLGVMVSLTAGTMVLMWLGEQISSKGIGNGISLIIFSGIVAGLPQAFISVLELVRSGSMGPVTLVAVIVAIFGLIYLVVVAERAQRKISVQYPKRQVGNKIFGGDSTHLPLKLNTAGVIPPIFANSILMFPLTIASFMTLKEGSLWNNVLIYLGRGKPLYLILSVMLIVFFSFFYTSIVFNSNDTAEMLKKNGGFLHGRRPGHDTAVYFDYVLTRLTTVGSIYISFICVLPEYISSKYSIPFYLGGTSFLIVVSVIMDTFVQIQSSLFAYQYESLIRKSKLRGMF